MFPVFCDMEFSGGGWTLIQHRFDGSTSFNRTWDEYKNGFGKLIGEFWLGNDKIHLLTKAKNMSLRIEIEDFEGIKEYAHYDHFYVANESQQYRLSIGGYSGTAGNAMQLVRITIMTRSSSPLRTETMTSIPLETAGPIIAQAGGLTHACQQT